MNKILVPVDFSETSKNALVYAISLFGKLSIEITVLHTYEAKIKTGSLRSIDKILQEDAKNEMTNFMEEFAEKEPDIVLHSKIVGGDSVSTIVSLGKSGKYDYIVMGTNGASGLKEVFIGSVAGGVISQTTAPVLVVPGSYKHRPLKEIVFAVSGFPFSSESVVEPLRKIAKLCSCKTKVLHLTEEKPSGLEEVLSTIEDLKPIVSYSFGTGKINQRINDYMIKSKAELLCLVRRKKGFFSRIFDESVTLKQTFSSQVPILILHN